MKHGSSRIRFFSLGCSRHCLRQLYLKSLDVSIRMRSGNESMIIFTNKHEPKPLPIEKVEALLLPHEAQLLKFQKHIFDSPLINLTQVNPNSSSSFGFDAYVVSNKSSKQYDSDTFCGSFGRNGSFNRGDCRGGGGGDCGRGGGHFAACGGVFRDSQGDKVCGWLVLLKTRVLVLC